MTEPSIPFPELRKTARAYGLLNLAFLLVIGSLLFIPSTPDPEKPGKDKTSPITIGAVLFLFGCTVNAARFSYEGGLTATVGGLFVPFYNIYLPFRVSKDTAAVLKHAGLKVGLFGVSKAEWQTLEAARRESLVHWMREQFHEYINGPQFVQFCEKLAPGAGRAGAKQLREAYRFLALAGQPVVACTLMRNVILEKEDEAAPALVMGTFDFTPRGWRNVVQAAIAMANAEASPETRTASARIMADEEYQIFRRRKLPPEIPGHEGIYLFDELMRGSDLPDISIDHERETNPITVLLAVPQEDGPSATMPREISQEALKRMIAGIPTKLETPPPLPS
jgi:hypothetical protein